MKMRLLQLSLLCLAACQQGGGGATTVNTTAAAPSAPLTNSFNISNGRLSGLQTILGEAELRAIDDAVSWRALWARHAGFGFGAGTIAPAVDFDSERVIVTFQGRKPSGGYAVEVVAVKQLGGGEQEVLYRELEPALGSFVTLMATQPHHFVRSPRGSGAVRFTKVEGALALRGAHGRFERDATGARLILDTGVRLELTSDAPLLAAGIRGGQTLTFAGRIVGHRVSVDALLADDVELSGELVGGWLLATSGRRLELTGPLAGAAMATPAGARLMCIGLIAGERLEPSSFRVQRLYSFAEVGGLLGLDDALEVDLDAGHFSYRRRTVTHPQDDQAFSGRLSSKQLSGLGFRVASTDVHALPAVFKPSFLIFDIPVRRLGLCDVSSASESVIQGGASLPLEVSELMAETRDLIDGVI